MYSRRTLISLPFAAGLWAPTRSWAWAETKTLRVFSPPGFGADPIARAILEVIQRNSAEGYPLIIENSAQNTITANANFHYRPGREIYVVTGDLLRRLQLTTKVQFKGFFQPVASVGYLRSSLIGSKACKLSNPFDLQRLVGTIRLPEPKIILGQIRQLAVPMVIAKLAPNLAIRIQPSGGAGPAGALYLNEIDLAIDDPDRIDPQKISAALMLSHPTGPESSLLALNRFTDNLPLNQEFFLAVDKSWPENQIRELTEIIARNSAEILNQVRRSWPNFQPSLLGAQEAQRYLDSYTFGKRLSTINTKLFQTCALGSECKVSALSSAMVQKLGLDYPSDINPPICTPKSSPLAATSETAALDLCIDPKLIKSSESALPTQAPEKSWWQSIKDFFTIDTSLGKEAGKGLKSIGLYSQMLDAINKEDFDKLDDLGYKLDEPNPKKESEK